MENNPEDLAQIQAELERLRRENEELKGKSAPVPSAPAPAAASGGESGGVEMASIQEGDAVLRRLIQRIAMILQAEKVVVMFYERETNRLVGIPPAYGVSDKMLDAFQIRANQGISGIVFTDGLSTLVTDGEKDPRTDKDLVRLLKVKTAITVPLIIENRDEENRVKDRQTIGVLHAFNKRMGEPFNDEDTRLLERMARNVGSIIANLQMYKKVMEEREELLQTFESITTGLLLVNPQGLISQINSAARAIFRAQGEVVGHPVAEIISDNEVLNYVQNGLMGEVNQGVEFSADLKGGERIYSVEGAVVHGEDRRVLGFVAIFIDITDQKNVDRMKSSFVAMASHELRTPLTAIKGFSSTLLEGLENDDFSKEEQAEFLTIITNECDRLRRLIDDLLNTARIEAGQSLKPDYGTFSLSEMLDKVVKVQNQASHKHEVVLEVHNPMPEAWLGDQDKFDQILTNLLNNAIKYSPAGGTVTVHAWDMGDVLRFGVQDQGIGIPKDHLEKVFERFHRVNNEDNRKIYGTGLGLFLVKHLVDEVHMGRIWAESEVGVGSTFLFEVPKKLDLNAALARNDD
jgi:two-component system phosphate regulon sensor histidine kinase PhoR